MTNFFDTTVGQIEQFHRLLAQAGMTKEGVRHVLAEPMLAGKMVEALEREVARTERLYPNRDYRQFNIFLHSLSEQLELLRELNQQMPDELRIVDEWLDLETVSDHRQCVTDLEFFFVVLESLEKTWEFNCKLIELTGTSILNVNSHLGRLPIRLHRSARHYEPGIHLVRINLVDNWDPEKGRSVDQVRSRAELTGKRLAAIEAVGAYALQNRNLFRMKDGLDLPHFDCAGLEQGEDFDLVPYFEWNDQFAYPAQAGSLHSGKSIRVCASPSLVV